MSTPSSDRVEVDIARPFRSVKEAVAVFGERILVGGSNSRYSSHAVATANSHANVISNTMHEDSSGSGVGTLSLVAMAEVEEAEQESEATAAIVPMYSAPSSPPSFASPRSAYDDEDGEQDHHDDEAGLAIMSSIKKLEAEVADTRREVVQLRKRGTEMEMAVASLNAQLHRGMSRLAEMEADKASAAARRSIRGDTDVTSATMVRSERWAEKSSMYSSEYLPSFSHALSLGEFDDDDDLPGGGGRRRKGQKVKPIVPLIGDILFSKSFSRRKSTKDSGDLYSVC